MFKWLWAKLTGAELVWLRDFDGEVTLAIARRDPWGNMSAERHWPWGIKTVVLLPDGKVDGTYVKQWKPVRTDGGGNG